MVKHCVALVLSVAVLVGLSPSTARASKCYVDSDCPTGMVCNMAGGCETPVTSSSSSSGGGAPSGLGLLLGIVVVGVLLAVVWYEADKSYEENTLLAPIDDNRQPASGVLFRF